MANDYFGGRNNIIAFPDHNTDGSRSLRLQRGELFAGGLAELHCHYFETTPFKSLDDMMNETSLNGFSFDHDKRALTVPVGCLPRRVKVLKILATIHHLCPFTLYAP